MDLRWTIRLTNHCTSLTNCDSPFAAHTSLRGFDSFVDRVTLQRHAVAYRYLPLPTIAYHLLRLQALILEDDVTPFDTAAQRTPREYSRQWARVWHTVARELRRLDDAGELPSKPSLHHLHNPAVPTHRTLPLIVFSSPHMLAQVTRGICSTSGATGWRRTRALWASTSSCQALQLLPLPTVTYRHRPSPTVTDHHRPSPVTYCVVRLLQLCPCICRLRRRAAAAHRAADIGSCPANR